jgi:hypothetical protein
MATPLERFSWPISAQGFRWAVFTTPRQIFRRYPHPRIDDWIEPAEADALGRNGYTIPPPGKMAVLIPAALGDSIPAKPLEKQPALFLRFAQMEPTAIAITAFANRFGTLTGKEHLVIPPWISERDLNTIETRDMLLPQQNEQWLARGLAVGADSRQRWWRDWWLLHHAVALWRAVQDRDADRARELITWEPDGAVYPSPDDRYGFDSFCDSRAERARPLQAAARLLDWLATHGLKLQHGAFAGIEPCVINGRSTYEPRTLLGAMWVQFAGAMDDGKTFRHCPARACPVEWFEVSTAPQGVREDAEFCSARCRHTAYRDRKKSARQLHATGRSVGEIARTLHTDVAHVREWVRSSATTAHH